MSIRNIEFRVVFTIVILLVLTPTLLFAQSENLTTFTTEDGTFSFTYPSDWFVELVNANQPTAHLSVDNLPLEERFESPEDINLQISLPARSFLIANTNVASPSEAITQVISSIIQPNSLDFATASPDGTPQPLELQLNDPDVGEFTVDNRSAAYGYLEMNVAGMDASQLIIVADLGNDYWTSITTSSYKGGMANLQIYEQIILEIVKSMRYTAPAAIYSDNPDLPQVYSGLDGIWGYGNIEFDYPADWYAYYSITPIITNKPNSPFNTIPQSGQFIAAIQGVAETRATVDPSALFNQCSATSDLTARTLVEQVLGNITPDRLEQLNDAGITTTQPEVITVDEKEIVYLRQYQDDIEILIMFIDLGEGNIPSMSITANKGELAQFENQLFAVAGTFQYTPKPCNQD